MTQFQKVTVIDGSRIQIGGIRSDIYFFIIAVLQSEQFLKMLSKAVVLHKVVITINVQSHNQMYTDPF